MATVGSVQIKIGAEVSSAINGLSRAEFAADRVAESFVKANQKTIDFGYKLTGFAANFATLTNGIQQQLNSIKLDTLDDETASGVKTLKNVVEQSNRVAESVTAAGAAFSGMQQVAGAALTGVARLIPSLGASIAGLAGPIGIAVGAIGAAAAIIITNYDRLRVATSDLEQINQTATKAIIEQKVEAESLVRTAQSLIATTQQREGALKKLNEISTEHFGNLKLENGVVNGLNEAYKKYTEAILNNAKAQAFKEKITSVIQEQLKLEEELINVKAKSERIGSQTSTREGSQANALQETLKQNIENRIKTLQKRSEILQKQYDQIKVIDLTSGEDSGSGSGKKTGKSIADQLANLDEELVKNLNALKVSVQNGLTPLSEVFDKEVDIWSGIINKGLSIDPNNIKVQELIDRYKAYFEGETLEVPVNIRTVTPVIELPNIESAADQALKSINDKFAKNPIKQILPDDSNLKSTEQQYEKIARVISTTANIASQASDVIFGASQANIDAKYAALEDYYEANRNFIESEVGLEGVKAKKLADLEKEVAEKRKAIKREEAAANKKKAIFDSIINTANAVTSALASGGPILAAIVGAIGLAQTAVIASTPLPALAKGGLVYGRNVVEVGEYSNASSNPELISPVDKVQKYIKEAVQESGSGQISDIQLYSRVSGDDLLLISERAKYKLGRTG